MADQINIFADDINVIVRESGQEVINVSEESSPEISIHESPSNQVEVLEGSEVVNIYDSGNIIVKIFEPGIRGPKGDRGDSGSGSGIVPEGTVSSSQQIIYSQISGIPSGILSSSQEFVFNSATGSFQLTSSFNSYTSSINQRFQSIEISTSSFALKTEISGAFQAPTSSISSSYALTASYFQLPNNLFSSSAQVDFGQILNKPSTIFSASAQVQWTGISQIPSNIVSGSDQLSSSYDLRYERQGTGLLSSSQQINQLIPNLISSSIQINTGSFSGSFNGDGSNLTGIQSSSFASTAQTLLGSVTSASYALTASFAPGYVLTSQTASMSVLSASYAPGSTLPSNLLSSSAQISSDISGSFTLLSGSFANRIYALELTTGSLNSFSGSITNRISSFESTTGSLNAYTGSTNNRLSSIELATGSLNATTGSILGRVANIEATTGSLNQFTGSISNRLGSLEVTSGSILNRLSSLQSATASYATTGSNTFSGAQTISGSTSITGSLSVIGQISGSFVGNGQGLTNIQSASYAISASYAPGPTIPSGLISSSAQFQSFNNPFTGSFTGSFSGDGAGIANIQSSSYALTASYALNAGSPGSSTYLQTIGVKITTQDSYISEGSKGYRHIGFDSNIIKVRGIANATGSINLNIKRNNILLGNYQLSNQTGSIDSTLSGWTVMLTQNDLIEFYISQSSTYITDFTFFMDIQNR